MVSIGGNVGGKLKIEEEEFELFGEHIQVESLSRNRSVVNVLSKIEENV